MDELTLLQTLRFKGRLSPGDLAAALGSEAPDLPQVLADATRRGTVASDTTIKISAGGREQLAQLLLDERASVDAGAMELLYNDFGAINADFKALVVDWQIKDGQRNAHDDASYDGAVLDRLRGVHRRVAPVIAAAALQLPRLNAYAAKLDAALQRLTGGDTAWLARPVIDSYHTVWFELHEELIAATGRTRQGEEDGGLGE